MTPEHELESLYFVATVASTCFDMTLKHELESLYFVATIAEVYTLLQTCV